MAPRLRKRLLVPEDFKSPQRLMDVLNPILESYPALLAAGVSLDNLDALTVTAKVTPPDEWTALELLGGCTVFNSGAYGTPGVRWNSGATEYRGLLTKPTAGAGDVARIPDSLAALRTPYNGTFPVSASGLFHGADVLTTGVVGLATPSAFGAGGFVSLWGLRHASSPTPPPWANYVDVNLSGPNGVDYGPPEVVLVLRATRPDRALCMPDFIPMWETPLVSDGRKGQRKLRIRRVGGLASGIEHDVTFLVLYR